MKTTIFTVDAFTDKPFMGNPAAVCVLSKPMGKNWMQSMAKEMNLSETAFLLKCKNGYNLRWFTPKVEVDLCGHATLASAHILWEQGYLNKNKTAAFFTKSGTLYAKYKNGWVELDFPIKSFISTPMPKGLKKALGIRKILGAYRCKKDYLIETASERDVKKLHPDFAAMLKTPVRGVIVTAMSKKYDFISRFFDPAEGINEDPVTGSAHCFLTPYWAKKLNRTAFTAYQASERGGVLKVKLSGSGNRTLISGRAVTITKGFIENEI